MPTIFLALLGATTLVTCFAASAAAVLRHRRTGLALTIAGTFALVFFASMPDMPRQMAGIALLAIAAGILLDTRDEEEVTTHVSFDETATRRR
jgi:FtsH-binding integral membrane protein